MRISLKGKCGTQMCGGCQELERESDTPHTPATKPGKTPLMENCFCSDLSHF